MRRWKRLLKWVLAALALLAAVGAVVGLWLVRRPWPEVDGRLEIAGLTAPVEVVRDRWGVPHIYADTEGDLFFAQGFVHAQDRLWQMEMNRCMAKGELAALVGPGPEAWDRFVRTLGLRRVAEREWRATRGEAREILEAYVAGINAFLDSHRGRLPLEYTLLGVEPEPWTPVDSLIWSKMIGWNLAENFTFELTRARIVARRGEAAAADLLPSYPADAPVVVPPELEGGYAWLDRGPLEGLERLAALSFDQHAAWGSNNWAVSGRHTASGSPILANDTHLETLMPSVWYTNVLHGGRFHVAGASMPSLPLVVLGHNGEIAWGVTDLLPDVQDFYVERLDDAERPRRYEVAGEWRDLKVFSESIGVKGGAPISFEVYETEHGPIVNQVIGRLQEDERPMALRWEGLLAGTDLLGALVDVDLATDWASFRRALSRWSGPQLNFVYADRQGHIGYQAAGRVPIRAPGHTGLVPVPGWTGELEWQGFIPFEELPTRFDPPEGHLATANNKVVGEGYPYAIAHEWSDPYRFLRILDLLSESDVLTVDDMKRIQVDTRSLPAETLLPHLLAVEPRTELERRALELVRGWNGRNEIGERGAAVYQVWYRYMVENAVGDELGDLAGEYLSYYWIHGPVLVRWAEEGASPWFDDVRTPDRVESLADVAARSLTDAVEYLVEDLGKDTGAWTWGNLHTATFLHRPLGLSGIPLLERLFNVELGAPGDRFSVSSAWFDGSEGRVFHMNGGTAQRLIVDLGDPDRSLSVQNSGQSGHLFHPHREDFVRLWRDSDYHPLLFSREAAAAAAEGTLVLEPPAESSTRTTGASP